MKSFFYAIFIFLFQLSVDGKLTILTEPVNPNNDGRYTGHYGVTRSLLEGLKELGVDFNYNPKYLHEVGDTVFVPGTIPGLYQAIDLKKAGKIKKLIAGPNLVVRPQDHNYLIASPEIDLYVVPSKWTQIAYQEDAPALEGRIKIWYAGINSSYWTPIKATKNTKNVLVYWKTEGNEFCCSIENLLRKFGWNPVRIRYGTYTLDHFKKLLSTVDFAVFISKFESQGLALAEAWAMNVPTLVWDPRYLNEHGKIYTSVSSCPLLTKKTGRTWKDLESLKNLLSKLDLSKFAPRNWVLSNLTDKHSASLIMKLIEEIN